MSFFKGPAAPARVPTDKVIPLHFWDDSPLYRRIALYNLKVFDDALDPEMLRSSLETLVPQDTWQKLGGRLRKNVSDTVAFSSRSMCPGSNNNTCRIKVVLSIMFRRSSPHNVLLSASPGSTTVE